MLWEQMTRDIIINDPRMLAGIAGIATHAEARAELNQRADTTMLR